MSLNGHDRQALAKIEETLADTDPQFAARLSAFARLADGGAMPERERIRRDRQRGTGSALCGLRPGQPGARRLMYWIAVAMAVAITLAVISAALASGHGGTKGACAEWQGLACARQAAPSAPPAPAGQNGSAPALTP
ncbi:MAG TPA: DUF3040 domain-containing protein [Streptosporangiaceae bacterium]